MPKKRPRRLCLALALALAACGSSEPATTTEGLAGRLQYERLPGPPPGDFEVHGPSSGDLGSGPLTVRQVLEDLHPLGLPGVEHLLVAEVPLMARGGAASGAERALAAHEGRELPGRADSTAEAAGHAVFQGDRALTYVPLPDSLSGAALAAAADLPAGSFTLLPGQLVLRPFDGHGDEHGDEHGDGPLTYRGLLDAAVGPQGRARVDLDGSSYEGFGIPTGLRVDLGELTWTEGAELTFLWTPRGTGPGELRLTVAVDGRPVGAELVAELGADGGERPERHRAPLPGTGGRLALEVTGDPGEALVLAPALTRPPAATTRPDLVVFLADTFRADNLAIGGGDPRITPNINAFAEVGVAFERAWSTASWTLPSQASLLTGLMPPRHGAVFDKLALDERHLTLGEHLGAAGYRTVAVTESGFLVPTFGMDQGFEEFHVGRPGDLQGTLARVAEVLEHDDGRPLFLYVQTFRAHHAYRASPEARAALADLLPPADHDWHFQTLYDTIAEEVGDPHFQEPLGTNAVMVPEATGHPAMAELEALYRGGSWDLDDGFGTFLELLEGAGLGDAPLVLTSDHGEAFGEHGIANHGNAPYEEELWIPMVWRLPDAEPALLDAPASLVDLTRTLCELADLPAPDFWEGRSLVPELRGAEPETTEVLAFEAPMHRSGLPAEVTLRDGALKVIVTLDAEGRVVEGSLRAHDLAEDPGEERSLPEATWAAPLVAELERRLAELGTPRFPPREIQLTPEAEAELRAMGYLGD